MCLCVCVCSVCVRVWWSTWGVNSFVYARRYTNTLELNGKQIQARFKASTETAAQTARTITNGPGPRWLWLTHFVLMLKAFSKHWQAVWMKWMEWFLHWQQLKIRLLKVICLTDFPVGKRTRTQNGRILQEGGSEELAGSAAKGY